AASFFGNLDDGPVVPTRYLHHEVVNAAGHISKLASLRGPSVADSVEAGVTNPARRFVVFGFGFGAEVGLATGARFSARVGNDPARISGSRASLSR
ncbi:MAG: hypothetical protein WA603_00935, partial [Candidatus Acidiferrales bacterium]